MTKERSYLVIVAKEVRTVKGVIRSDGLWCFACGNVFDSDLLQNAGKHKFNQKVFFILILKKSHPRWNGPYYKDWYELWQSEESVKCENSIQVLTKFMSNPKHGPEWRSDSRNWCFHHTFRTKTLTWKHSMNEYKNCSYSNN